MLFYFPNYVYPNPPCQLPSGRKPECPEKTHDFRRKPTTIVTDSFHIRTVQRIEPTTWEVKGACPDGCTSEARKLLHAHLLHISPTVCPIQLLHAQLLRINPTHSYCILALLFSARLRLYWHISYFIQKNQCKS